MSEELKSCPFCGGKATLVETANSWCNVLCDKCGAMTRCFINSSEYASKTKAVEALNRRYMSAQV